MSQIPPQQTPPPEQDRSTLILVLGILSLIVCWVLGPFAWMMGREDLAKIRAGKMDPAAEPLTKAGMICGIIATAVVVVSVLAGLLFFLLSAATMFAV